MKSGRFTGLAVLLLLLILPILTFESNVPVEAEKPEGNVATVHRKGETFSIYSRAETVREALETKVGPVNEEVFPSPASELVDGMHIFLGAKDRAGSGDFTWQAEPDRRTIKSRALPAGRRIVIQGGEGEPGSHPRVEIEGQTEYKKERLEELREQGTLRMLATAYSPHYLDTAPYTDGLSAIGIPAGYGLVAVDPRVIPLGTILYVEGYGYGIAADVGGDIKGNRIDLCFPDRQEALIYGRQYTRIHIIG